jgi:predicted DNA-binding transcriptional regulator AlpA
MADKNEPIEAGTVPLWPCVGRRLGLGRASTYEAYHRGDLPVKVIKIGKKLLVLRSELDRLLA